MSAHKGHKAALLQAMQGGQLVDVTQAVAITGMDRKRAASTLRRGVRDGWWRSAGVRHLPGDRTQTHMRYGIDDDALRAYADATQQAKARPSCASLNRRIGAVLGGITDLQGIKARCKVDENSGCWNWRFAIGGHGKVPSGTVNGRNSSMVRQAFGLHQGRPVQRNFIVWRTCCNSLCLNPAHLRQGTRQHHGKWVAETGSQKGDLKRIAASRAAASTRTVVTAEIAREILMSDRPRKEWAAELGVRVETINRALSRRTEGFRNSSVFAWRPAA